MSPSHQRPPRYKARVLTSRLRLYAESDHLDDTLSAVIAALARAYHIPEPRARAWTEGKDETLTHRHGPAELAWIEQR